MNIIEAVATGKPIERRMWFGKFISYSVAHDRYFMKDRFCIREYHFTEEDLLADDWLIKQE